MQIKKIFLASSAELKGDRDQFEIAVNRKNKEWIHKGIFLELIVWEDFLDALSQTRLQDEYNKAISECDIFVMLFWTKVGKYTAEEFATAFGQFKASSKPFIFAYFKDVPSASVEPSLAEFQRRLDALGHFPPRYASVEALTGHFNRQLDKLVANGFIEFKWDKLERVAEGGDTHKATMHGSGSIAQGYGARAVGAGGVMIGGNNSGTINTGTQTYLDTQGGAAISGKVEAGGHFIGRDFIQIITHAIGGNDSSDEAASVIAHYLEALAGDLAGLKLSEIDVTAQEARREPLQLADIYVPLNTHWSVPKGSQLSQSLVRNAIRELADRVELRPVSALEALATHSTLTLLGKPGSGKSTFGARVLLTLALAWRGDQGELANLGEHWTHGALLPVRIILRRFAEALPPGGAPARARDLWRFIDDELNAGGYGLSSKVLDYIQRIARDHGALILLDGLDECGDAATRQRVQAACDELMRSAGRKCRFLLTARPYARPGGTDPKAGVYALADLNDEQIEVFIRAWYAALAARGWQSPGDAERKMLDLLEVRQRPDLLPLAQTPLLLTLMATLHSNRGRLPDDRADLYNESVDLLLLRWNRQSGADKTLLQALDVKELKLSDLREALEQAAFKVHEENIGSEGTADIGEDRLVRVFRPLLDNKKDKADVVIDYIEKRAGLLLGQGELDGQRQFTFPHRTFQEFLAACHLAAKEDFPAECARLARTATDHWGVVLPLAARVAKAERGASAADELIHGQPVREFRETRTPGVTDWACARVAGQQLIEIGLSGINKSERTRAIAARVAGWLAASLPVHPEAGGESAVQRALAGDVLAALGDPRFNPQRYHLPVDDNFGFVCIAPDQEFRIGTRKGDAKRITEFVGMPSRDDELNDKLTPTPQFLIARYPVTVAQFRAFAVAANIEPGDENALRDPDSRPVRYVSWNEALEYCYWLHKEFLSNEVLKHSDVAQRLRQGWRIILPSELEWQKAARGGMADNVFSWGDDPDVNRANYGDTQINDTSAVGCFPGNNYGLHDMVGNVWEWTRSLYRDYPYGVDDGREDLSVKYYRVVCGGSWHSHRDRARCAFRYRLEPEFRHDNLGFRVVLRSPPPPSDIALVSDHLNYVTLTLRLWRGCRGDFSATGWRSAKFARFDFADA